MFFSYDGITKDGYLRFNATNIGNESIDNQTMDIHWYGSGPYSSINYVDIWTKVYIDHLPVKTTQLLLTEDQVFKVWPIIHRPLIFFGMYLLYEYEYQWNWMSISTVKYLLSFTFIQVQYEGPIH